jgi:hypothetical protein
MVEPDFQRRILNMPPHGALIACLKSTGLQADNE